jgi:hypothetical protein
MNTRLDEIRVALKCLQDIDSIKLPEQWFAIAFNRILYTNFAPKFMWDVLLDFCSKYSNDFKCYIGDERFFYTNDLEGMDVIDLSEQSIAEYLLADFRFTRNHVILNSSDFWVVRLDQDVTYFLFHVESWEYISELLGGFSNIENSMLNDFDGIKGQSDIVENYVSALLQNIKPVAV